MYVDGVVDTVADLARYSPPGTYVGAHFCRNRIAEVRARYPDHCLIYGTHIGILTYGWNRDYVAPYLRSCQSGETAD